tara:strand:+ start:475 stop:1071 length:597 start_codon:yes stop_codon:yes gene_type:complete
VRTLITYSGLRNYESLLERAPEVTRQAAVLALNRGAKRARTEGSREIRKQVNLTRGYVDERLVVKQFASKSNLFAVISGRVQATSLRRFGAKQSLRKGKSAGVIVGVKRGRRVKMKRAFFIKLKGGGVDSFNTGIAVRLRDGEAIEGKKKPFDKSGSGLYLLYGPSVDQVWGSVKDDIFPSITEEMNAEFNRQFARLI